MMRSNKQRRTTFLAATAALMLALSACGGGSDSNDGGEGSNESSSSSQNGQANQQSGEITAAVAYETQNYDPSSTSSALALGANWHVMESLYELDMHDYTPYAALAKDEPNQISDTSYEVTLRDDAKFSDGSPLTADDVCESVARSTDEESLYSSMLGFLDSCEAKDETTVVLNLNYPFSLLKERLSLIKVVPKDSTVEEMTAKPVGSGPWKYDSIDEKNVKFSPNEYYNGPKPAKAASMKWDIIKDDVARTNAMQGGSVAVMESVPFQSSNVLEAAGVTVEEVQGFNLPFLMFNTKKAPFDKKETRQAFFYAIDTQKLIDNALDGQATPVKSLLPENHRNYNEAKTVYSYDVDKAKELLKAGGGEGATITILTTDQPWITKLAPQIKQDLEAIGLNVEVSSMASASLYSQHADVDNPSFDVVLAPGDPSVFGNDPDLLMNWWYGDNLWTQKRSQWKDTKGYKALHEAMDKAVATEGDEQQEAWNEAFDIISDEVPIYPLFHRQVVTAFYNDKLDGYSPIGTTGLYFIDVAAK